MLVYTLIFICITCPRTTATEEHTTVSELHYIDKKDLNLKHDRSTIQTTPLKIKSKSYKLTFQTLYPHFMSTWSSLNVNEKQRQVSQGTMKKEGQRQYLSTKKINRFDKPTVIERNSIHKAFIEVETMKPYVLKRRTTSKTISKSRLSELRNKMTRSRPHTMKQVIRKQVRNLSTNISIPHHLVTHLNKKLVSSSYFLKDQIKRNRILTTVPTSYPLQKLNSIPSKRPQRKNSNGTLLTNRKQVLTRLEQLESDLKKFRRVVKNGTEVINHLKIEVQEKDKKLPDLMIKKKISLSTATLSVENAKMEAKSMKSVNDIKPRSNSDSNYKENSITNKTKSEDMHDYSKNRRHFNINEKLSKNIDEVKKNDRNENWQDPKKVNQLRMEWLKQKLSGGTNQDENSKRKYNNSAHIDNEDEEIEYTNPMDEFSWFYNRKSNNMSNKHQTDVGKKGFGDGRRKDFRNIDDITEDPLAYDSIDLLLEHESNIQEFVRLKNANAIPTYKPTAKEKSTIKSTAHSETAVTDSTSFYNDNGRRNSLPFAPPPGFNKTHLLPTDNKNYDQEAFDDVLKKILSVPSVTPENHRKDVMVDDTEALGRKMLERLDIPGLNVGFDDTIPKNGLFKVDHIKYVDNVMRQKSLPLYERRNVVMKSLNKKFNQLYKKHNLKPIQSTKDDLDNVLKSMGATLHK